MFYGSVRFLRLKGYLTQQCIKGFKGWEGQKGKSFQRLVRTPIPTRELEGMHCAHPVEVPVAITIRNFSYLPRNIKRPQGSVLILKISRSGGHRYIHRMIRYSGPIR